MIEEFNIEFDSSQVSNFELLKSNQLKYKIILCHGYSETRSYYYFEFFSENDFPNLFLNISFFINNKEIEELKQEILFESKKPTQLQFIPFNESPLFQNSCFNLKIKCEITYERFDYCFGIKQYLYYLSVNNFIFTSEKLNKILEKLRKNFYYFEELKKNLKNDNPEFQSFLLEITNKEDDTLKDISKDDFEESNFITIQKNNNFYLKLSKDFNKNEGEKISKCYYISYSQKKSFEKFKSFLLEEIDDIKKTDFIYKNDKIKFNNKEIKPLNTISEFIQKRNENFNCYEISKELLIPTIRSYFIDTNENNSNFWIIIPSNYRLICFIKKFKSNERHFSISRFENILPNLNLIDQLKSKYFLFRLYNDNFDNKPELYKKFPIILISKTDNNNREYENFLNSFEKNKKV